MLAIRLQRVGRKGYPTYRVAVQEAQRHPSSGRVVAYVGNYNPHSKAVTFDKEKTELYLKNGAQPSPHVVKLLVQQKISLPDWVVKQPKKDKKLRNPDKLRKNQATKPTDDIAASPASNTEEETGIKEDKAQSSTSADNSATSGQKPAPEPAAEKEPEKNNENAAEADEEAPEAEARVEATDKKAKT